jgi:hypothetical protein
MDSPQFLSADGFPPELWGPGLWLAITLIAANYPLKPSKTQAEQYYKFFIGLQHVLPCGKCRCEYTKLIQGKGADPSLKLTPSLFRQARGERPGSARKSVFAWVIRLHNAVNMRLGKRSAGLTENGWARRYASLRKITRSTARRRSAANKPLS